jgi:RimJ/RimL family protein N-acetyltransferase
MDPSLWPLAGLRLRTDRMELRPPTDDDLPELADLYPHDVPFDPTLPVAAQGECARSRQAVLRHVWRSRAELDVTAWRLCFAAYHEGALVGQQDLKAVDFPTRRIVESSSWIGAEFRGRGLGKAMRAIVLHLAFEGFGARAAESESAEANDAALGVTRSLGYTPSGDTYSVHEGVVEHMLWSRLTRERWALQRQGYGTGPVTIEGLEPCLELLGLDPDEK